MTENALVIRDEMSLQDTMTLGQTLAKSGYFDDAKDAAKAVVKILAGREMGLGPIASMTGIYIIQKRVSLGANLMAAAVKRDPRYDYRVLEMTDERCEIVFFERGEELGHSVFTAADARKAGTKNMDKFPRNMLFARAMSNGAKWYTPDAFGGAPIYTPEELGATVDGEGDVVTVPSRVVRTEPPRDANQAIEEAYGTEHVTDAAEAKRELGDLEPPLLGLPADTDLDYTPEWIDTDTPRLWGKLYFEARKLGYANDSHVKGALAQVYGIDKWNENEQSEQNRSYRESWHLLQEHQRSKVGDARVDEPFESVGSADA